MNAVNTVQLRNYVEDKQAFRTKVSAEVEPDDSKVPDRVVHGKDILKFASGYLSPYCYNKSSFTTASMTVRRLLGEMYTVWTALIMRDFYGDHQHPCGLSSH